MKRTNEEQDSASAPRPARRLTVAGLIVGMAMATAFGGVRLAGAQGMMGHHGMGAHAAMDPAEMNRHVDALVDEVLPDGSAEQKARLAGIVRSAHADIAPFHRQLHQAHARAQELLMQPHVDRAALESLRAEEVRQLDAASRRLVQAAADASDMLTPEQRQLLFAHLGHGMH
ncbi:MAG: periplasmic heavy metal sensor [Sphingomonadaceae bacterium]|nr:periplasmic heavy metal sensor [Sphingomonadaceae bacterium]